MGLARMVGHHGKLIVFEPRQELHQQLCANLVHAGLEHVQTHAVLPVDGGLVLRGTYRLHSSDDYCSLMQSNSTKIEAVISWPLDTLQLDNCRLLLVSAPMPFGACLQGARDTIERLRPVVIIGLIRPPDDVMIRQFFNGLNYQIQTLNIGSSQAANQPPRWRMLVAQPYPQ